MTESPLSEVLGITPIWEGGSHAEASLMAAWGGGEGGVVYERVNYLLCRWASLRSAGPKQWSRPPILYLLGVWLIGGVV